MANAKPVNERDELLIEILKTLRYQAQSIFELTADVEGLKAVLTLEARKMFESEREKTRGQTAFSFDREIRSLGAAVERLRGT